MSERTRKAFTIVELLVVISIIALLVGILLPAIGKARDSARLRQSSSNLRQLGAAHQIYAAEWDDRQYSLARDNFGAFGNSLADYEATNGPYIIPLGWARQNCGPWPRAWLGRRSAVGLFATQCKSTPTWLCSR